ncbi:hypothetical protein GGG87_02855 [Streptococcus sp. zg-86]|uniref:LXG domain-containing protein n=1 Tax=Streptococcus zhangguiae TaxID=2664091 RepID=A0ABW9R216_9STRE|nr:MULTISPECIES: hypothetical protein [unclassified Streptococcus]MTB63940.1 hypothetical protein [Streptococcus sp. zg-86]MTB90250.1 hypothetical protein [Streptococcus sp. zg-36]QTH46969.1 hypothetical protein J5M87_05215 [Streptococcus sp. zg-86]
MGVDMNLEDSQSQATSISGAIHKQNSSYQSLQSALSDFAFNSGDLSGVAYDSAKAYCSQLLLPLTKACILLNEAIAAATKSFPSTYVSEVDSGSLREDELRQKITQAGNHITYYQKLRNMEYRSEQPNYSFISSLTNHIDIEQNIKRKLEEKR